MSGHLSDQDRTDLEDAASKAAEALALIRAVEKRHALDITGPALAALNRAEVELEMAPIDIRSSGYYLDGKRAA